MAGKVTMPIAKAMTMLPLSDREKLWATVKSKPEDQAVIDATIADLEKVGAIQACCHDADRIVEEAWNNLDKKVPDSFSKLMLRAFGWFVVERGC